MKSNYKNIKDKFFYKTLNLVHYNNNDNIKAIIIILENFLLDIVFNKNNKKDCIVIKSDDYEKENFTSKEKFKMDPYDIIKFVSIIIFHEAKKKHVKFLKVLKHI